MNLVAMIGVVEAIKKSSTKDTQLCLKVERPFAESKGLDDIYEMFKVNLNSVIFKDDIEALEKGTLVGVKGRLKNVNGGYKILTERFKIY